MQVLEWMARIDNRIIGGVFFTLFALTLTGDFKAMGVRDYLFVLALSVLSTIAIIEKYTPKSSLSICSLIGLGIGFLADDIYLIIRHSYRKFLITILSDLVKALRDKINK